MLKVTAVKIEVGGETTTGSNGSVAASSSGPGGVFIATQTETYPIACINSDTHMACNSTSMPNNVVTATGAGANYNGNFVPCNPTFDTTISQSNPNSVSPASFLDQATGYTSVQNGTCMQQNPRLPRVLASSLRVKLAPNAHGKESASVVAVRQSSSM
jgi:hypothetical protein